MRRNYSDEAWRNKRAADRDRIAKLRADPAFRASENAEETERYRNLVANSAVFANSVRRSQHEAWDLGVCATFEALTELVPDFLSAPTSTRVWAAIRKMSNPYGAP